MLRKSAGSMISPFNSKVFFQSSLRVVIVFALLLAVVVSVLNFQPARAATTLSIEPITWNVIGLDSNNVNVGPQNFPVGVRVCNTSSSVATDVTAAFVWDSANTYINIRPGTEDELSVSSLAVDACTDFYFEVQITRNKAAYDTTRSYHIEVTESGTPLTTWSTPTPRELYVEHLISQSRNSTEMIEISTDGSSYTEVHPSGTVSLMVGQEYYIKLTGFTATNGYEQIETFISLPNTIFQVLSVETDYTADSSANVSDPNDKLYGDSCTWVNDPLSPNYRSCVSTGKNGGDIFVTYKVKILSVPADPLSNPEAFLSLIYDFSGSSYHYNADYSDSLGYFEIVNASLAKSFEPKTINPDTIPTGTSTLTFTITNPGADAISDVHFIDNLPSNGTGGQMSVTTSTVTYTGCGTPSPSSLTEGQTSLSFTDIEVSGLSTCTIAITVTADTAGTYNNTSGHLYIGAVDTNSYATDALVATSRPPGPTTCTPAVALATWTMAGGGAPPPYTTKAADVSTALATAGLTASGSQEIDTGLWGITDAWLGEGLIPSPSNAPYFQFEVDTSEYGGANISFQHELNPNGAWAAKNDIYVYSSINGTDFTQIFSAENISKSLTSRGPILAAETGASKTWFRIVFVGRKSQNAISRALLDNITINGCPRPDMPTLDKAFSPASIATDSQFSTLKFDFTNPNPTSLSGVEFSDTLPAGLEVDDPNGVAVSCSTGSISGQTIAAVPGSTFISLGGATLAANSACSLSVNVKGTLAGDYHNVSGNISSTNTGVNTTSTGYGTSDLEVVDPPIISKTFVDTDILTNGTTTLTFSIINPNYHATLESVAFNDATSWPSGLVVATPNGLSGDCDDAPFNGTITAAAGSSSVSLSGLTLAPDASCTFSVDVLGNNTEPIELMENTTDNVSHRINNETVDGNTATANLVVRDVKPGISLLKQVSDSAIGPWYNSTTITAGTDVYYRFIVENVGDVLFSEFEVNDSPLGSPVSCTWYHYDTDPTEPPIPIAGTELPPASVSADPIAYCVYGPVTASAGDITNIAAAQGLTTDWLISNSDHANYKNYNYGHLPSSYLNMNLVDDGGAMQLNGSTYFGAAVTTTASDGINTVTYTPKATDDGVTYTPGVTWVVGGQGSVDITVVCDPQSPATSCYLNAWIDWNKDSDFTEIGDQIFTNYAVPSGSGTHTLTFNIPAGTVFDGTDFYSRFRISNQLVTNPSPNGLAVNGTTALVGEIEDPFFLISPGGVLNAAIGDRIWLDEDGDGVQDAGEAGIPNVVVELRDGTCAPGSNCLTTVTDSEGNYMFAGITSGSYVVAVISGLPAGLSANPTYDEDGVGTPNTTSVTVSGGEHVTADFGYNWASTTDVTSPGVGATAAIGDRIWNDADGDGIQDTGEAGISGVTVTLVTAGTDGLFGTADDVTTPTTTDAAGNYIFDDLAVGAYKIMVTPPAGYTQKSDPDQSGTICTTCDNQTTTTIILAPGDVYVNADFGYQLNSGANTIGDHIFLDANGDGNLDSGEPGIPGVTVALLNNSGTVIATTITDANGQFSFPGLPNGTYTVWVNDTANVLGNLVQNSTPDNAVDGGQACGTCNGRNTVTVSGSGNTYQDFGYAPRGHGSGDGLIGDAVFLDRDGGNDYDAGEGLAGVTVRLYQDTNTDGNYDAGEPVVAVTTTNQNGNYYFGNLPAGSYVVVVDATTLPAGVTNTVDPDVTDSPVNESGITLGVGDTNLLQDFGYRDLTLPNTISGTIWNDVDADGTLDGDEPGRYANVTMVLRDANGDMVATTLTDADGNYSFSNLPDGTYRVDVTDSNNILNGYWHSTGPVPGVNNNSQSDPYTVNVSGGQSDSTADFGYYFKPADVSDFVWLDRDQDGVQDADEPGKALVKVTLTSTYPNGTVSTVSVLTDSNGFYRFGNLLLDENHDGAGAGEPIYALTFTTPPGSTPSPTGAGTPSTDSNGANLTVSPFVQGQSDATYDSGFYTTRLDLGDLPVTYPTLFGQGAAHLVFPDENLDNMPETSDGIPAVWLGSIVDVEPDGQPDVDAIGDDITGVPDEDGLSLASTGWIAGGSSTATITLNASEKAVRVYFGLWIDWDRDGSFETFYTGSGVTASPVSVNVTVAVPDTYVADTRIYMRARASDFSIASTDYQGTRVNGEVEDYWYEFDSGGTSTPVTLSYFKAERQGEQVLFNWSTATETGNIGFNIYVGSGNKLKLVNEELIPSHVIDSLERQDYSLIAKVGGNAFFIEDVDVTGETRRHGPFVLGEEYGSLDGMEPVDWEAVESDLSPAYGSGMEQLKPAGRVKALNLQVRQTGLYRITYEMLRDAGLDLNGVRPANISVTQGGRAVPVYVLSTRGKFGPGNYIEFYGVALDTLYTDTNIYTIQLSQTQSPLIRVNNAAIPRGTSPVATYFETVLVNNQRTYTSGYTPGTDPWYDNYVFAYGSAASLDFPFEVNGLANPNAASALNLVVWGMLELPQKPDHHIRVSINGIPVADEWFDGVVEQTVKVTIPGGVLQEGTNTLTLSLPFDTGGIYDLVYLDKFSVTYRRLFNAQDGRLTFTSAGKVFRVKNLPTPNVVVYRLVNNRPVRISKVTVKASGGTYTATFPGSSMKFTYLVSTVESLYAPAVSRLPAQAKLDVRAQYLVISHPSFIAGLQPLVQARRAQGLTVNVVNVNDLYAKYTYGVFDPKAIQDYIAYAAQNLGTQYVLLVGGDTYDYRNYLGRNSISFIPSLYTATSPVANFVPADPLYADLDGDKVPDLAIGRMPVRTTAELELMVNKTLAYQNKDYGRTAVFASDKKDGFLSFKNMSTSMSATLPSSWTMQDVHLDDLSVTAAQAQLLTAMNRGTALVNFTGHSGPTKWTFSGLFGTKNAAALTNAGRPFVVVQWGCWNTYYVDPVNNYLVQSFLFSGDRGAAAVLGASTLVDSYSEELLGKLLTPRLVKPGMTLGQALLDAKQELAMTHPDLLDVLLGWSLMGDPALVIEP